MAHGFLQSLDQNIEVHSAGTHPTAEVNPLAIIAMNEIDIDISTHTPKNVAIYLNDVWDYIITVCNGANETCPIFTGEVNHRLHLGFDDPAPTTDIDEFRRVRDEIKQTFTKLYLSQIAK